MEVEINGARILTTFENVPLFGTVQITQTLVVAWLVRLRPVHLAGLRTEGHRHLPEAGGSRNGLQRSGKFRPGQHGAGI